MSIKTRRRINYALIGAASAVLLAVSDRNMISTFILGIVMSHLAQKLWRGRAFTIGLNGNHQLYTQCHCHLCEEGTLVNAPLSTTIGFALGHARQHTESNHE